MLQIAGKREKHVVSLDVCHLNTVEPMLVLVDAKKRRDPITWSSTIPAYDRITPYVTNFYM